MTVQTERPALNFSALQLAWMLELGIDKPWIPGDTKRAPVTPAVAQPLDGVTAGPLVQSRNTSAAHNLSQSAPHTTPAPVVPVRRVPVATQPRQPAATPDVPATVVVDTARLAAGAADLEALAAAAASCQGCSLCKEREQVVVGQGVLRPAIMVIGEAPGDQEDRQGVPFVGRSGMLLDNMLSAIGSGRDKDIYTANIIKCRPPGNRNPRPEEIAACRPFLMRQIELVRPLSILALGRFAAHTLLGGDAPLADMRQQAHSLTYAGSDIPVVVSYHPAYLLRRPADKAAAWQDLQKIKVIARQQT